MLARTPDTFYIGLEFDSEALDNALKTVVDWHLQHHHSLAQQDGVAAKLACENAKEAARHLSHLYGNLGDRLCKHLNRRARI